METWGKDFFTGAVGALDARGGEPAILDESGRVMRTFAGLAGGAREQRAAFASEGLEGSVAVLCGGNSIEWPEIFLGLLGAGASPVPCEEAAFAHAREAALAVGAPIVSVRRRGDRWVCQREGGGDVRAGAPLYKLTSGTESRRRLVAFSVEAFSADAKHVAEEMGIGGDDRNLAAIPFSHSYGLTSLVGLLLLRGVAMVLAPDPMPAALAGAALAGRATVFPGVPAHFRALGGSRVALPTLRLCICAGAPLSREDALAFHAASGLKAHSFYGASECGGICYDADDTVDKPDGYVGTPLAGVRVAEEPEGEWLRLRVSGPALGLGYVPSAPGDRISPGGYVPGDLLRKVGGGYAIEGRDSDFIDVGGRKVNARAVGAALCRIPGVRDACVVGLPSRNRETVAACVATDLAIDRLRAAAAELLAPWEMPREWVVVDRIDEDARGKRSRRAILEKFSAVRDLPASGELRN